MTSGASPGPIAAATAGLAAWLADTTGATVLTGPPVPTADPAADSAADSDAAPVLALWPLELRPEQVTVGVGGREPFRFRVRHVAVPGGRPDAAAEVLDRIVVAAVAAGQPTIVLEPLSPQLWLALGVTPRLALTLDVAASVVPPSPEQPLVREPLRVDGRPVVPLRGRIVGPGDVPLAGIHVQLASTGAATYTDARGQFSFGAVPAGLSAQLRLRVKQRSLSADVGAPSSEPVVIHCDTMEV
jgi:hypothetical protein